MEAPKRLTPPQARQYLGCTEEVLKNLRRSRKIRFYRLGHRSVSYDRDSLDNYLYRTRVEALK